MKITRISMISGVERTWDLDITEEQYDAWANRGLYVQDAFPHLTVAEREFLMTGITPDEWDDVFLEHDDDNIPHLDDDEPAF